MLPVVLGVCGLVAEYGNSLVISSKDQRVADLAAYAGALAYTSGTSETAMTSAGQAVTKLNGLAAGDVALALVTSPRDSSKKAVRAVVTTQHPLFLSPILGTGTQMTIRSVAYAQVSGQTATCLLALDGSRSGVTLGGGANVTASNCAVSSNSSVTVPCGTRITAREVDYVTTVSQPGCTGITGTLVQKSTADPLAGNAAIATARARIATVGAMTMPVAPAAPAAPAAPTAPATLTIPTGKDIDLAYNDSSTKAQATAIGCTADKSGSTWTLTCPPGGTYNFKTLSVGGGLTLNFSPTGNAATTYTFNSSLTLPWATQTFGPGVYRFAQDLSTNGTTTISGSVYVGGKLTAGQNTTIGGDVTVIGAMTATDTRINGTGTLTVGGSLTTNGTTVVAGTPYVVGTLTTNGTTTFNGSGVIRVGGSLLTNGTTKFNGTPSVVGALTTSGTTNFYGTGTLGVGGALTANGTTTFAATTTNVVGDVTLNGGTTFPDGNYTIGGQLMVKTTSSFGAGTFKVSKGISTSGSAATTFGAGTFQIGPGSTSCNSAGTFSICNMGSTLTIAGPSTFAFTSGVYNNGGSTLYLGRNSTTNSFKFGVSSSGDSLYMGGGAKTYLSDALGPSSVFEMGGNLNSSAGGGSCLTISAAAQHDIKGYLSAAGGVIMGAGVYTIDGYFALGAHGGGSACGGVTASSINIVVSGKSALTSGTCAGLAFCVGAGYSGISLSAPTTGPLANMALIGPAATAAGYGTGATFTEGASAGQISGLIYVPVGAITLGGGAGLSGGSSCLQLIGSQVTINGGSTAVSECVSGAGGGSGGKVSLVQ